jgi:nitrogen fixation NifU-like protein
MIKIRTHNIGEVLLTPEHHVLAIKIAKFSHKRDAFQKNDGLLDWFEASLLEKGDVLLYPILKETKDRKVLEFAHQKPRWDFRSISIPDRVSVDRDFLRLCGYYLAEGFLRDKVSRKEIGFVFGSHEEDFIKDSIGLMRKVFGLEPSSIREAHNATNIVYYRSQLVQFFQDLLGKGALNKHIPHWMMVLPPKRQESLLCGLWRGDGYINEQRKVSKFVTISEELAYQVRTLLLRQRIVSSFLITSPCGVHKKHYSIYIKEDSSIKKIASIVGKKLSFPKNEKSPYKSWFDDNYYYVPISKLETIDYNGFVYNLEVEKTASYVVSGATLHNCGDVMRLYIKIRRQGTGNKEQSGVEIIEDAKFQTLGCGAAIATSSMATEMIKGKPLKEALKLTNRVITEALGGLPPAKRHCSVLAAEAVKKAVADYRQKKKAVSSKNEKQSKVID